MESLQDEKPNPFQKLFHHLKEYFETRIDLALLNGQDRLGDILSSLASVLIMIVIGLIAFILLNIGLAVLVGKLLHNIPTGFFILGGFYVLVGVIIWVNQTKWIKYPVTNSLLAKINIHEES